MEEEEEDNIRLRRAKEFLGHSREQENELRRELARAVEQTATAKKKYEELFMECEQRAAKRRKEGKIPAAMGY